VSFRDIPVGERWPHATAHAIEKTQAPKTVFSSLIHDKLFYEEHAHPQNIECIITVLYSAFLYCILFYDRTMK